MVKFIQSPRGTRDIIEFDAEAFEYLVDSFKRIAWLNGFKPIITPTIEFFELFSRKSGEEIIRSMYVFKDKAGRLIALRPEVTASIVRAYLRNLIGRPKPILLYYVSQCFRYEEPQRGRYREFWQLGLEVIGEKDKLNSDLRVALTVDEYLEEIGVDHWFIVGNVGVYRAFMESLKISHEDQDHVLHLIDKELIDNAKEFLSEKYGPKVASIVAGIVNTDLKDLVGYINEYRDLLGDQYHIALEHVNDTIRFIDYSEELGLKIKYEPKLVRGLAYYTGLIYEVKARELDISIGGGGRYDNLTMAYGGSPEYMTGIALGLDRIMLVINRDNIIGSRKKVSRVIVILLRNDLKGYKYSYNVVKKLHALGITASLHVGKPSKLLSYASKKDYTHAIIVGDKEISENKITVKNLLTGRQIIIDKNKIIEFITSSGL